MIRLERQTLAELAIVTAEQHGAKKAYSLVTEAGETGELSYADFGRLIKGFAGVLAQIGIKQGDRVMILAENRPEWPIAYFGIAVTGAVTVPVLVDFLPEHIGTVAAHAEIRAICATAKTLGKILSAGIDPSIPVLRLDTMDKESIGASIGGKDSRIPLKAPATFPVVEEKDLASIIYTSGTTGKSKGVMLSHKNIVFDAIACRSIIKTYPRDRFLSVLPLAHSYECTIGLVIATLNGASTAYLDRPPSPAALLPALRLIRPTYMMTVPLIIEKVYRNKIQPALEAHPLYKLPLTRGIAIKAAGKKLMATFGNSLRFFGIGGAALAPEVEAFLYKGGFPYAIGYGLTETAPMLAGAPPFKTVLRSTGPAMKGVQLRIMDAEGRVIAGTGAPEGGKPLAEGEIQAHGPNVMLGYYKDPERTKEVFTEDGWFRTGDLGCLDAKGRLFIRGRLKAMILGASGENIYPEEIESVLNASGLVEESLVYEGEKGELVALVVLNERTRTLIAAAGDAAENVAHSFGDAATRAGEILNDLKTGANKRLAAFSRIKRVEIHHEPFEKTATQKIKRFLYPRKPS